MSSIKLLVYSSGVVVSNNRDRTVWCGPCCVGVFIGIMSLRLRSQPR